MQVNIKQQTIELWSCTVQQKGEFIHLAAMLLKLYMPSLLNKETVILQNLLLISSIVWNFWQSEQKKLLLYNSSVVLFWKAMIN